MNPTAQQTGARNPQYPLVRLPSVPTRLTLFAVLDIGVTILGILLGSAIGHGFVVIGAIIGGLVGGSLGFVLGHLPGFLSQEWLFKSMQK